MFLYNGRPTTSAKVNKQGWNGKLKENYDIIGANGRTVKLKVR